MHSDSGFRVTSPGCPCCSPLCKDVQTMSTARSAPGHHACHPPLSRSTAEKPLLGLACPRACCPLCGFLRDKGQVLSIALCLVAGLVPETLCLAA